MIERVCLNCKNSFQCKASVKRKYCSHKCYREYYDTVIIPKKKKIMAQELLDDLKKVYDLLGHAPLINEYKQYASVSPSRIHKYFSTFADACRQAGFEPAFIYKPSPLTPEEMLQDIRNLSEEIGHPITYTEYIQRGRFASVTARRLFGSFHKALVAAGFEPEQDDWDVNKVSAEDGGWLSGFVEGEGSFVVKRRRRSGCQFTFVVGQRADRADSLLEVCRILDLPSSSIEYHDANGPNKNKTYLPTASVAVKDLPTVVNRICAVFTRFPLRGKKQDDFRLFKAGAMLSWKKYLSAGKRHYTPQENIALQNLTKMSILIKRPNVTMQDLKSMMQS